MKSIYIVRHGQSAANAGLVTHDPALIPLTDMGWQQARSLAKLFNFEPRAVITSNYERAKDTAVPYCSKWQMTPLENPLLHEFVMLSPALVSGTEVKFRLPQVDAFWAAADPYAQHGSDSESFADLAARVSQFRDGLHDLEDGTVIFGHGLWFAMLIWQLQNFDYSDSEAMSAFRKYQLSVPMPNCAVYRLISFGDGTWAVHFDSQLFRQLHGSPEMIEARAATMGGA